MEVFLNKEQCVDEESNTPVSGPERSVTGCKHFRRVRMKTTSERPQCGPVIPLSSNELRWFSMENKQGGTAGILPSLYGVFPCGH